MSKRNFFVLCSIGIFIFFAIFCLKGYAVDRDSYQYVLFINNPGIMPLYPLFIFLNRIIFKDIYLYAVIWEQTILTTICITIFVYHLSKRINMSKIDIIIAYLLCLMPLTVYLPDFLTVQSLLTEGIAYPVFYIYILFFLESIWTQKISYIAKTFIMALVMSFMRSQLQILIIITMFIPLYIYIARFKKMRWTTRMIRFCTMLVACFAMILIGIFIVISFNSTVTYFMQNTLHVENYRQDVDAGHIFLDKDKDRKIKEKLRQTIREDAQNVNDENEIKNPEVRTSQYSDLIRMCGMYEIDAEDIDLFEDIHVKQLFTCIYNRLDEGKMRYPYAYAEEGLWKWQVITQKRTNNIIYVQQGIRDYIEIYGNEQFNALNKNIINQMSLKIMKAHWNRMLCHAIQLLAAALMSTVFFQMRWCYLLCQIITLCVYVTAIMMIIYGFRKKNIDNRYVLFLLSSVVVNVMMAVILSTIFIPLQRYLVYGFGVFYIAYWLLLKQIAMQWNWSKWKQ